ncbi:DUF4358 domain-containing protein [Pseudoflavonifractor sp. AF19-9AC]|uniref:DUF4358 domain-containing protein n=1 Tax=Pseudoflavonifractor sp. AF19-9AC TaxID=2292244 RepID=UPI000E4F6AEF|nr:DUF4358 domain-containing protein [Pseudoflavonifractor sp. AF19-9AC]RHR06701.1 DUF4358 domain-containing protein [Pseudoflavonifractor sp. AF19-9AC]
MKKWMLLLAGAMLVMALVGCGSQKESLASWTEEHGQEILSSGAFSEELEELDLDTAFLLYKLEDGGLSRENLTGGLVRRSAGATCEELAVLIFDDEKAAETAVQSLQTYLEGQIASNTDYRPAEIPKLEGAWVEQRGNTVLMVVANDVQAAKDAVGSK